MGVDIYAKWDGQTEVEANAQITGWHSAGALGYLRGSYFGGYSDVLYEVFHSCDWEASSTPVTLLNITEIRGAVMGIRARGGTRPGHESDSPITKIVEAVSPLLDKLNVETNEGMRYARVEEAFLREMEAFADLCESKLIAGLAPQILISW